MCKIRVPLGWLWWVGTLFLACRQHLLAELSQWGEACGSFPLVLRVLSDQGPTLTTLFNQNNAERLQLQMPSHGVRAQRMNLGDMVLPLLGAWRPSHLPSHILPYPETSTPRESLGTFPNDAPLKDRGACRNPGQSCLGLCV